MVLKHPEYAHGISDTELIKEAIQFCDEELDSYDGMEYDDDSEVCCQRSNTFIRELVRRVELLSSDRYNAKPTVILDDHTMQKLREALRFSASRSVMSSADEIRILSAFNQPTD